MNRLNQYDQLIGQFLHGIRQIGGGRCEDVVWKLTAEAMMTRRKIRDRLDPSRVERRNPPPRKQLLLPENCEHGD